MILKFHQIVQVVWRPELSSKSIVFFTIFFENKFTFNKAQSNIFNVLLHLHDTYFIIINNKYFKSKTVNNLNISNSK